MKALVIQGPSRPIALESVPESPRPGECRLRVSIAGICGTDLQLLDGYAGFRGVPGHEFVGVVEDVPSEDDAAWLGRRVVGEINIGCGRCELCARGVKEHCANRAVVGIRGHDGAFAEYLWIPAANLHAVPDTMDDRTAVFVEPVAAACRVLEQVSLDDRVDVAVLGDGRLGLLVAQVVRTATPHVTVHGRHPEKLSIARALGMSVADPDGTASARYDVVVDATGRPEGLARALELVKPRGTVLMKSTFHGEAPIAPWPIVVNEVSLVGSRCGPFDRALELLASGVVSVAPLVTDVVRLEDYDAAFHAARRTVKVLFDLRG